MPLSVDVQDQPEHGSNSILHRADHPALLRFAKPIAVALVVLAAVPLIGWIFRARSLTLWFFDRASMRPCVAIAFLLIGIFTLASGTLRRSWQRWLIAGTTGVIGVVGLLSAVPATAVPLENWILGSPDWYEPVAGANGLPVLTSLLMLTLGAALSMASRWHQATHVLLVIILFAAYVSLVGQVFGADRLYRLGNGTTMPAMSALGLGLTAAVLLISAEPRGLLRFLTDRGAAGVLVRPVIVAVPLALPIVGWVSMIGHQAGLLDHAMVIALVAASGLLVVTVLARWAASRLQDLDAERARALVQISVVNEALEVRIAERTADVAKHAAMFSLAFESAPVGMALLDLSGRIGRANTALCTLLGGGDLIGIQLIAQLHAEDRALAEERRHQLIAGEIPNCTEELRLLASHGEFHWVSLAGVLLRDGQGYPLQILIHVMDIDERKNRESQLTHLADHDPLTGLLNRRGFGPIVDDCMTRNARYQQTAALIVVDLDNFKAVNDICGHECGDLLLIAVAAALRRSVRQSDAVARTGGDEFAVLLPDVDARIATRVAQQLVDAVRSETRELHVTYQLTVTASAGIAMFDTSPSGADIMRRADRAMYLAKDAGRDRYVVDHPSVSPTAGVR